MITISETLHDALFLIGAFLSMMLVIVAVISFIGLIIIPMKDAYNTKKYLIKFNNAFINNGMDPIRAQDIMILRNSTGLCIRYNGGWFRVALHEDPYKIVNDIKTVMEYEEKNGKIPSY